MTCIVFLACKNCNKKVELDISNKIEYEYKCSNCGCSDRFKPFFNNNLNKNHEL